MRRQCELLHITRSTLYYEPKQPDAAALLLKEEIMPVGRKLVRSCMQEMGIHAVYPKANLSKRNFRESVVPYLLRNKVVYFPNQVWSVDITYIKMHRRHMYLTAIIDWYSRKIVGWNLSDTLDTQSVIAAVQGAVETHGTPAILNSDQGCQFTSEAYKNLLKEWPPPPGQGNLLAQAADCRLNKRSGSGCCQSQNWKYLVHDKI